MLSKYCNLLTIAVSIFFSFDVYCNEPDYKGIFGTQWKNAEQFVADNSNWMKELCFLSNVDYNLAISIVFPELIRYSAIRDKIEITLLKSLYVHKGAEYSDFSIGKFQIKPSCAETVLHELKNSKNDEIRKHFNKKYRFLSKKTLRIQLLDDLEDTQNEFLFVIAIVSILDKTYSKNYWRNNSEKIRFYATAYNTGFNKSKALIEKQMNLKFFHIKTIKPFECYSYANVAEAFYLSLEENKKQKIPVN